MDCREKGAWTDPKLAYKHGMRDPSQSIDQAAKQTGGWISTAISNAQRATDRNLQLAFFGYAFHAVSDMTSPAHEGYQPWRSPTSARGAVEGGVHFVSESEVGFDVYRQGLAVSATRRLYADTFGNQALTDVSPGYEYGGGDDPVVKDIQYSVNRGMGYGAGRSARGVEAHIGEAVYLYNLGLTNGWNFNWSDTRRRRP